MIQREETIPMKRLVTLMLSATLACAMPMALAACGQKADTGDVAAAVADLTVSAASVQSVSWAYLEG
jgi:hypothetical protein